MPETVNHLIFVSTRIYLIISYLPFSHYAADQVLPPFSGWHRLCVTAIDHVEGRKPMLMRCPCCAQNIADCSCRIEQESERDGPSLRWCVTHRRALGSMLAPPDERWEQAEVFFNITITLAEDQPTA
jgi:hypothetical protein